jgi:hypothetical protein
MSMFNSGGFAGTTVFSGGTGSTLDVGSPSSSSDPLAGTALETVNPSLPTYAGAGTGPSPVGGTSTVNLGGASLATVTPNPTISSVGANSSAQDFQALDSAFSNFGSMIASVVGSPGSSVPVGSGVRTVVVTKPSTAPSMGMILLLIGAAAVLYLVLTKKV